MRSKLLFATLAILPLSACGLNGTSALVPRAAPHPVVSTAPAAVNPGLWGPKSPYESCMRSPWTDKSQCQGLSQTVDEQRPVETRKPTPNPNCPEVTTPWCP